MRNDLRNPSFTNGRWSIAPIVSKPVMLAYFTMIDSQRQHRRFRGSLSIPVWTIILFLLNTFCWSSSDAEPRALLNAYRSPLSALTAPNNFYFLEFPLLDGNRYQKSDSDTDDLRPICGDGSPYSFAFKRGTDPHLSKLVVEFQGGPACFTWGGESSSSSSAAAASAAAETNNTSAGSSPPSCICQDGLRQTPWNDYVQNFEAEIVASGLFPPLDSCTGVTPGFVRLGHSELMNVIGSKEDVPLSLRQARTGQKEWWQALDEDIQDWSYLLLPHCTLDWNLGHQPMPTESSGDDCNNEERSHYFRGGSNLQAVLEWVNEQFGASGGLEALITLPSGKVGGCFASEDEDTTTSTISNSMLRSVGPMIFANGVKMGPGANNQLILVEGSDLFAQDGDIVSLQKLRDAWNPKELLEAEKATFSQDGLLAVIQNFVLKTQASFAWFGGIPSGEDELATSATWWADLVRARSNTFHLYIPSVEDMMGENDGATWDEESCPIFAFPDKSTSSSDEIKTFLRKIARGMSWSSNKSSTSNDVSSSNVEYADDNDGFRLTFLSILTIIVGLYLLGWAFFFFQTRRYQREGILPLPKSPNQLWLMALTHHPGIFLLVSLFIPVLLSLLGFAKSDYQVLINLDFDSYLEIETDLEIVSRSYSAAQSYQEESLLIEEANCDILEGNDQRKIFEAPPFQMDELSSFPGFPSPHRDLQYTLLEPSGPVITLIYQNRNGGSVFTPEVLYSIRDFEQSIYDFPGFEDFCYAPFGRCVPFDSIVPQFFPNGGLVNSIDGVLRTFLDDETSLWKMDQYFGPANLGSNITRTFVWLRDSYLDPADMEDFLKRIHRDLFWKVDQKKPYLYPDMVFTWQNDYLTSVEANEAVNHDALWASGSFMFIGLMIFFKVRNGFVFLTSMLGLGLSFLTAYYWCLIHFDIPEITLLHVSSLFVMMGIGADDIFLMVDSFEHTKITVQGKTSSENDNCEDTSRGEGTQESGGKHHGLDAVEVLRERMKSAYSTAGSMMLVSSLTTAICFFSNAFAVVVVIKEFGIYMGMVVLVNFIHVMTILPSAILVNEFYIVPWKEKRFGGIKELQEAPVEMERTNGQCNENGQSDDIIEQGSTNSDSLGASDDDSSTSTHSQGLEQAEQSQEKQDHLPAMAPSIEDGPDEYRVNDLNRMDRWLMLRYSPFVQRRRKHILIIHGIVAVSLGIFGITSFAISDGNIVLFSEKYNLGRLTPLNAKYFNGDLTQTIEPDATGSIFGDVFDGPSGAAGETNNATNPGSSSNQDIPNEDGLTINPDSPGATSPPGTVSTDPGSGVPPSDNNGSGSDSGSSNVSPPSSGGSTGSTGIVGDGSAGGSTGGSSGGSPGTDGLVALDENGLPTCYNLCQNGGICNFYGSCSCGNGWAGETCALPICPINGRYCTGNGDCIPHPNGVPGSTICRCFDGFSGRDCSTRNQEGDNGDKTLKRRQAVVVSLVWGAERLDQRSELWAFRSDYSPPDKSDSESNSNADSGVSLESDIDVAHPQFQEWMLKVVKLARNATDLSVQTDKPTWIEILERSAVDAGLGFPVPRDLFVGYLQLLKDQNADFASLIRSELGTRSPGLAGDFLFASVTLLADVVESARDGESLSSATLRKWTEFVDSVNAIAPPKVTPAVAQSRTFLNAHRSEETISSTATSWIIANALCLLIILMFTRSIRLSLMVMSVIILIFLCLAGVLFGVFMLPFGPVEALGVSIFIGLSANYSLHIVHAYQHSPDRMLRREDKVRSAIFTTGSPIIASALSTIGGCLFLFGCRTYVFVELGLLICSITIFALVFSMCFLPAWLSIAGPLLVAEKALVANDEVLEESSSSSSNPPAPSSQEDDDRFADGLTMSEKPGDGSTTGNISLY